MQYNVIEGGSAVPCKIGLGIGAVRQTLSA